MFPSQQGNELCFQISSNPQNLNLSQDLILPHSSSTHISPSPNTPAMERSRRRKFMSTDNNHINTNTNTNTSDKKKLMHRDIERQRRQEMTTLYSSLRSLLPLEYIKGKRSISDHMNEAVNYIKHMQKRISELKAKRDHLKRQSDLKDKIPSQIESGSSSNCRSPIEGVIIRPYLGGLEILFSSGLREQDLTLSRLLQVLLEAEISVVNCVSTKVNERAFHSIHAEVEDPSCLNLSELQQKLNPLVS